MISWIDRFVEAAADEAESPEVYRRWSAITTIGACLEQKVWINSPTPLYPNMYILLIGPPATGKSRTIGFARNLLAALDGFPFAPTSVTMASLVDSLKECERKIPILIENEQHQLIYNSMTVMPDDLQVFMSDYNLSLIAGLTTFYDVEHPYRERRRTGDLNVEIKRPQLSILGGTTPSHLFSVIPEEAWNQGFTSRLILIYSAEKTKKKAQFNNVNLRKPVDLIADLEVISSLKGEFHVDSDAERAFANWLALGEPPLPKHKRLEHYLGRRYPHLLKLSMVSSVDRGNSLVITVEDFNRALGWLVDAEDRMPEVFDAGPMVVDGRIMEEIWHYMKKIDPAGNGMPERKVKSFLLQRIPAHYADNFWKQMIGAGFVKKLGRDAESKDNLWLALDRSS